MDKKGFYDSTCCESLLTVTVLLQRLSVAASISMPASDGHAPLVKKCNPKVEIRWRGQVLTRLTGRWRCGLTQSSHQVCPHKDVTFKIFKLKKIISKAANLKMDRITVCWRRRTSFWQFAGSESRFKNVSPVNQEALIQKHPVSQTCERPSGRWKDRQALQWAVCSVRASDETAEFQRWLFPFHKFLFVSVKI